MGIMAWIFPGLVSGMIAKRPAVAQGAARPDHHRRDRGRRCGTGRLGCHQAGPHRLAARFLQPPRLAYRHRGRGNPAGGLPSVRQPGGACPFRCWGGAH